MIRVQYYYYSRIKWHLFFLFRMGAHKEEKKRPCYSAAVIFYDVIQDVRDNLLPFESS